MGDSESSSASGASQSYYDILGIAKETTEKEIRSAYIAQSRQWHPDKNPDNVQKATERMQLITEAYNTLSNPALRAEYDLTQVPHPSQVDDGEFISVVQKLFEKFIENYCNYEMTDDTVFASLISSLIVMLGAFLASSLNGNNNAALITLLSALVGLAIPSAVPVFCMSLNQLTNEEKMVLVNYIQYNAQLQQNNQ
jgi:hypothetical protein